jgi:hypothetical protein
MRGAAARMIVPMGTSPFKATGLSFIRAMFVAFFGLATVSGASSARAADSELALIERLGRDAGAPNPCAAAGPQGELVLRVKPGCPRQSASDTVRGAVASMEASRATPECARLGICRPSRSFKKLHSIASARHEGRAMAGKAGGPRYFGQKE